MNKTYLLIGLAAAAGLYFYTKRKPSNTAAANVIGATQLQSNGQPLAQSPTQQAQAQIISATAASLSSWITGLGNSNGTIAN